jgi:hypothetical protein
MKNCWTWIGCVVVALLAGCDTSVEDAKKAAEKAAAEVEAKAAEAKVELEQASEKAKEDLAKAGEATQAEIAKVGEEAKASVEAAAESLKIGDLDLGKDFQTAFDGLKSTLDGVTNAETAQAALPKLDAANLKLDSLLGFVDQIPAAARPTLAKLLKTHSTTLTEQIQKITAIEGVGPILKPVLDQIVMKLEKATATAEAQPAPAAPN